MSRTITKEELEKEMAVINSTLASAEEKIEDALEETRDAIRYFGDLLRPIILDYYSSEEKKNDK